MSSFAFTAALRVGQDDADGHRLQHRLQKTEPFRRAGNRFAFSAPFAVGHPTVCGARGRERAAKPGDLGAERGNLVVCRSVDIRDRIPLGRDGR